MYQVLVISNKQFQSSTAVVQQTVNLLVDGSIPSSGASQSRVIEKASYQSHKLELGVRVPHPQPVLGSMQQTKNFLLEKSKADPVLFAVLAQSGERRPVTSEVRGSKPLRCAINSRVAQW